ncbi:MAG: YicC/YloC family endoribonuclease [Phycisphaerales bacterium]
MTGYGEASIEIGGVHYFLEIRSLNSRYFKATIRLPEEFQGLEAEIESELRRTLSRGSVTLSASCTDSSAAAAYTINHKALAAYVDQIRNVPQVASGSVNLDLGALLSLPGVLQPPADEEARHGHARTAFLGLLERAGKALLDMRAREGAALVTDLLAHRDVILDRLAIVRERTPKMVETYELRLRQRIDMMVQDPALKANPVDLIREIAVFAERSDISEEVTRLTGHMEQYTGLLSGAIAPKGSASAAGAGVGRTLDFLAQEMLREANTMASKSSDAAISRAVVEIKGAIDRIKEQVQNIE